MVFQDLPLRFHVVEAVRTNWLELFSRRNGTKAELNTNWANHQSKASVQGKLNRPQTSAIPVAVPELSRSNFWNKLSFSAAEKRSWKQLKRMSRAVLNSSSWGFIILKKKNGTVAKRLCLLRKVRFMGAVQPLRRFSPWPSPL